MSFVSTKDGVEVYYKDWGRRNAQPIVFHHGWPLSEPSGPPRCCQNQCASCSTVKLRETR